MINSEKDCPIVSIAIITKDRRESLKSLIASLKACEYPKEKLEIVVVEETDEPQRIDGVKYIFIPRRNLGFGYARNVSVRYCTGEYILFIDDDCTAEKGWIKKMVQTFTPGIAGVSGTILIKDESLIGKCETALGFFGGGLKKMLKSKGAIRQVVNLSTGNCGYRKDILEKAGGFDENARLGGEDFLLSRKVCKQNTCLYNPHIIVYHEAKKIGDMLIRLIQRERASFFNISKLEDSKRFWIRNVKNSLIVRFLLLVIVLSLFNANNLKVYFFIFSFYYLFLMVRDSYHLKYYGSLKLLFILPLVKVCFDVSMECGRIWGTISFFRIAISKHGN